MPQAMPPRIKVLLRVKIFPEGTAVAFLPAEFWAWDDAFEREDAAGAAALFCGLILFSRKITGISTREPMIFLVALKVNGPTASPPSLWATKAIPQMVAVKSRISEFFSGICCFFIIKYPLIKFTKMPSFNRRDIVV